jgi:hypothetical protein
MIEAIASGANGNARLDIMSESTSAMTGEAGIRNSASDKLIGNAAIAETDAGTRAPVGKSLHRVAVAASSRG